MPGVERTVGHLRDVSAVAEEDVAVQVPVIVLRRVHSYEQKAVNLPGWLFWSAILTFSFQIVPATCGLMKALIGGLLVRESRYRKAAWTSAGLFWIRE